MQVRTLSVEVIDGPDRGLKAEADTEFLSLGTAPGNVVVLSDPTVSGYHLELSRGNDGIVVTDLQSTNGTMLGDIRITQGVVPPGTQLRLGRTSLRVSDGGSAVVEVHEGDQLGEMRGRTAIMRRVMAQVERVARTTVPVLVIGESGTGKELVARAIHDASTRAGKPFITVDCGALAPTLVASELFGHERGAFTGADRQHVGAFERANGGTLFLDEIGELPADLQPQLLGALERRRFLRVGGKSDISVDVRVVCATNRDLRAEVNAGSFRMDLYYRIAVVTLRLPALRERIDDVSLLAEHFLRECGHEGPVDTVLTEETLNTLLTYRWPGNVRELRNWVEATVAMGESPELRPLEIEGSEGESIADRVLELPYKDARNAVLHDFEARYLSHALEATKNNVTHASRRARMDRSYLIKLLQKHGLR